MISLRDAKIILLRKATFKENKTFFTATPMIIHRLPQRLLGRQNDVFFFDMVLNRHH